MDETLSPPYHLSFEPREKYLYAYVEGEHDNYAITKAFWLEIAAEANRIGATHVLIDENIVETVSIADVFQFASELPKLGFDGIRVAFVDRYLEQHEINQFGELVAVNRGFNGKAFNNFEEAEAWLLAR